MNTLMILAGILIALKALQIIYRTLKERKKIQAEIRELEHELHHPTAIDFYD